MVGIHFFNKVYIWCPQYLIVPCKLKIYIYSVCRREWWVDSSPTSRPCTNRLHPNVRVGGRVANWCHSSRFEFGIFDEHGRMKTLKTINFRSSQKHTLDLTQQLHELLCTPGNLYYVQCVYNTVVQLDNLLQSNCKYVMYCSKQTFCTLV